MRICGLSKWMLGGCTPLLGSTEEELLEGVTVV